MSIPNIIEVYREFRADKKILYTLLQEKGYLIDNGTGHRMNLFKGKEPEIFEILNKYYFFSFHCTNKGKRCSVAQIRAYFSRNNGGWKKALEGHCCQKGQTEIHHYDHNPSNNSPNNLEYVTPELNKLATVYAEKAILEGEEKVIAIVKRKFQSITVDILGKMVNFAEVISRTIKKTKNIGFCLFSPYGGLSGKQLLKIAKTHSRFASII
jgi:HNH endonuclease